MAKKPTKPTGPRMTRGKAAKTRKAAPTPAKQTSKQDQVLTLLRRQNGASIDEIVAAKRAFHFSSPCVIVLAQPW